ncbi:MAG: 16S rRNA (guanine(966)-N(2))-methyltransferase RsmD [Gammaproteobacteria bacterium]|nr:16S rRNA (guanine(966)-N(2))-methyltransferase RsmD [Gammaproteobacteria bacterium]
MRIIAGRWRGRRIAVPDCAGLRPTPDRVRETLFNWIMPVLSGARCLDLCAGTGALGLEAASRDAAEVVFVESDRRAADAIEAACARLQAVGVTIMRADVRAWLAGRPRPFDIVFLDPPYQCDLRSECCRLLDGGWLAVPARVYVERPRGAPAETVPPHWRVHRELDAGRVHATLYHVDRDDAGSRREP